MKAITLIIFGLMGYWIYFSLKKEGILWIPKIILCIGGFVGFYWGITFLFPFIWQPFLKSTSALGQLTKTIIFGIAYSTIYCSLAMATIYKWGDKIDKKIEERISNSNTPYK